MLLWIPESVYNDLYQLTLKKSSLK